MYVNYIRAKSLCVFNNVTRKYDTESDVLVELQEYPGYLVTPLGEVFNKKTKRKLKQYDNYAPHRTDTYKRVHLRVNKNYVNVYVHRLVALAFLEDTDLNPNGTPIVGRKEVDHKDSDRDNNNVDNLQWCDTNYNLKARYNKV